MQMKCAIAIRCDDPLVGSLYHHLAALPAQRGKRYRARLVSQVLEVGSAFLFSEGHQADQALVLAYRSSIPAEVVGTLRIDDASPAPMRLRVGVSPFFASTGSKGSAGRRCLQLRFDSHLELRTFERFAQDQGLQEATQVIETPEDTWSLVCAEATLRSR